MQGGTALLVLQGTVLVLGLSGVIPLSTQAPEVNIPGMGRVFGSTSTTSRFGRTIYNFRGLPYAQPPSGPLRFQPPLRVRPWSGVLNATTQLRECPQTSSDPNLPGDPEDCLHLNVFTPTSNALLPVMVFVHGGSFLAGSSKPFVPDFLLDKDVVLVPIQYRLGLLGFLSTHTDAIPGNAALLDVVEALTWVRDFIRSFGGNPGRVTVFGQSAGSVLASLLLACPPAQGLFHGLICQSGSFLAHPYLEMEPLPHADNIAELLGCTEDPLEGCLANTSVYRLNEVFSTYLAQDIAAGGDGKRGGCPVVQRAGSVLALPEHPAKALQDGRTSQVPIIFGTAIHEGIYYYWRVHESYVLAQGLSRDETFLRDGMVEYILRLAGVV